MDKNMLEVQNLIEFHDSYRKIDWHELIKQANHTLVICVYYWDKWVKEHENVLHNFLKKPSSSLQFFFSSSLPDIQRLFPNHSIEELTNKMKNTYQPLQQFLKNQQLSEKKIQVHHIPFPLNYSMQCIDDQILVLSPFEMFRNIQVDAPAMQIDLTKTPNTKQFYQKELEGLNKLASI